MDYGFNIEICSQETILKLAILTSDSVKQHLLRISDVKFVIKQCKVRMTDDVEVMGDLLKHGLKIISDLDDEEYKDSKP
eukprot:UN07928